MSSSWHCRSICTSLSTGYFLRTKAPSVLVIDLSEFIFFFQETKEMKWFLGANTLSKYLISSNLSFMKACYRTCSEYSYLIHEEFCKVLGNLGYDEATPDSCYGMLGVCWPQHSWLCLWQLSAQSLLQPQCWDANLSRHWSRAHNGFTVRILWCGSLYNANEICYLASNLFISGCSLASHSPRCPIRICTVYVSFK